MKVPNYIINIMERAKYEYDSFKSSPDYAVGYTIKIRKSSAYTKAETFKAELEKLKKWIEKNSGEMIIIDFPDKTHYTNQSAIITIFDPVMKHIEQYIHA